MHKTIYVFIILLCVVLASIIWLGLGAMRRIALAPKPSAKREPAHLDPTFPPTLRLTATSVIVNHPALSNRGTSGFPMQLDSNINILKRSLHYFQDQYDTDKATFNMAVGRLQTLTVLDLSTIKDTHERQELERAMENVANRDWGSRTAAVRRVINEILSAADNASDSKLQVTLVREKLDELMREKAATE